MGRKLALASCAIFFTSLICNVSFAPSRQDGRPTWNLRLAAPAQAQNYGCGEIPPIDENDGDGDECNAPGPYKPPKNLGGGGGPGGPGGPGSPGGTGAPDCTACPTTAGDPINFVTGNEYEAETDYAGAGPFPIVLTRYYNSQDADGQHDFGQKWRSSYSRSVNSTSATSATVTRDDGRAFVFNLVGNTWTPDPDVTATLIPAGSGWQYFTGEDEVEVYGADGHLQSVANRAGLTQTVTQDGFGNVASVTDPFGRRLTFSTGIGTGNPPISSVTTPDGGVFIYSYDAVGNLAGVTNPDRGVRAYAYGNSSFPNNLTGITDELGNLAISIGYDAVGQANSSERAGGVDRYSIDHSYKTIGSITVINPLGGQNNLAFATANGTVQSDVSRRWSGGALVGQIYTYYSANGAISSQTDWKENVTTRTTDPIRALELTRNKEDELTTTTWDPQFRLPLSIKRSDSHTGFLYSVTAYVYGPLGDLRRKTVTTPRGTSVWRFTHNANGQLLTATDPLGNLTKYAYDSMANLVRVTNALGQATAYTSYDSSGRPLRIVDPNGLATTLTYNFRGQVTSTTAGTWVTANLYDAAGQLARVTRPDGSFVAFTYDAAHRLVGVADALGAKIAYTLDAAGNVLTEQVLSSAGAALKTHSRSYDQFNHLVKDVGAYGQTSAFIPDLNGNVTNAFTPLGYQRFYYFDRFDRLTQTNDPLGNYAQWNYDSAGRLTYVSDPGRLGTNYYYNPSNDITRDEISSRDSGLTTKGYDDAGNLANSTDGNGKTTTYGYDALNRVVSQKLADGSVVAFQYDQGVDGIGHLTTMTDPVGITTWTYNLHGQVKSKTQQAGGATLSMQFTHDASGRLTSLTYPSGAALAYGYDADGHVRSIRYAPAGGGASVPLLSGVGYFPFGASASQWTAGNGAAYRRTFDLDGRVTRIAMPGGDAMALTYDLDGRITGIAETGLPAKTFQYDALARLTNVASGRTTKAFTYDANGNRASATYADAKGATSFAYAGDVVQGHVLSNHLLGITSGATTESFVYDAAGNTLSDLTNGVGATYGFDARNRLAQSANGAVILNYGVNGLGQLISKANVSAGSSPAAQVALVNDPKQTTYVYDEAGHPLGQYDGSGLAMLETVWLGDLPVATIQAKLPYYVAPDQLGAPHEITDGTGALVWRWDHDPFGVAQPTGALSYPLRFPGQNYVAATGLHGNGWRDYNPATGRYLEGDPIGLAGGLNPYAYAGGNPVSAIDPQGKNPLLIAAVAGALLGAGGDIALQLGDNGFNFGCINWGEAAHYAVEGALFGATAGFAAEAAMAGLAVDAAVEAAGWEAAGARATAAMAADGAAAEATAEQLTAAAGRAADAVGEGNGAAYGTAVHAAFATEVRALGSESLTAEQSYLNGKAVSYGTRGSVRADVIEGPIDAPTRAYDLKTGSATLTPSRIAELQRHLPGGTNVPVTLITPP